MFRRTSGREGARGGARGEGRGSRPQQDPGSGSPSEVPGGHGRRALCPQPAHRAEAGFRSPNGP